MIANSMTITMHAAEKFTRQTLAHKQVYAKPPVLIQTLICDCNRVQDILINSACYLDNSIQFPIYAELTFI